MVRDCVPYFRKEVRLQIDPIVHKNYHRPKRNSNDIALLKLAEDVDLNTYTPACLAPIGADYTGQNGRVYGKAKGSLLSIIKLHIFKRVKLS